MRSALKLVAVALAASLGLAQVGWSADDESLEVKGVKLHYTVEGKGPPVVLLHGLMASADLNWRLPGIIAALSKDCQVIALDLPGHGKSDKPEAAEAYGVQMVEDVVALMDHLNIKKAHVVGYSMGGMITMKLMATRQDRVLTGVVGGMGWLKEGGPLQKFWEDIPAKEDKAKEGAHTTPPACIKSLGKLALSREELMSIRVPAVVLVGDKDPVRLLYVAPLERARKDWPVVEIKDAGHITCILKPQFKEAIKAWLDAHP